MILNLKVLMWSSSTRRITEYAHRSGALTCVNVRFTLYFTKTESFEGKHKSEFLPVPFTSTYVLVFIIFVQQMHNIHIFFYMFRCSYTILRKSLTSYAKVTKLIKMKPDYKCICLTNVIKFSKIDGAYV